MVYYDEAETSGVDGEAMRIYTWTFVCTKAKINTVDIMCINQEHGQDFFPAYVTIIWKCRKARLNGGRKRDDYGVCIT